MAALLATLKAGGAYVPRDRNCRGSVCSSCSGDAGCAALINAVAAARHVPRDWTVVICLDGAAEIGADEPVDNLDVAVTSANSSM